MDKRPLLDAPTKGACLVRLKTHESILSDGPSDTPGEKGVSSLPTCSGLLSQARSLVTANSQRNATLGGYSLKPCSLKLPPLTRLLLGSRAAVDEGTMLANTWLDGDDSVDDVCLV